MLQGCTPWPEEYARRYRELGLWQDITLWQALEHSIRKNPDKTALVCGEERISYGQLGERVAQLAGWLAERGLRPTERVIVQLPNGPDFVVLLFALLRIGVIPVLALPAHRQAELRHFIGHSGAVAYFCAQRVRDFDYRPMAKELAACCSALRHVFFAGEWGTGHADLSAFVPSADEVALMLLSGGTTGLPKLIPRTHNDYLCSCSHSSAAASFDAGTVFLAALPMAHNYTLGCPGALGALLHGGTVVIATGTTAESVFPLIERERVTVVAGAVPLVVNWLNSSVPERHDVSSLKIFMSGGAKLVAELRRRIEQRLGCLYMESYGTGEGLLNQTRLGDAAKLRYASSGRPVCEADEIKVVDDAGRELPDGQPGELLVRGPYTVRGYYNAPDATRAAYTEDGFYRMGDIVRRRNGYLYFEGRRKDLINRGGEKISSEEVENHLLAFGKVKAACVVAMPDDVYGEKACAFVIPAPGATLNFEELKSFLLRRDIAKFKFPERLEIVGEFPLSPAGKILRRELRRLIAEKVAAERSTAK